MGGEVGVGGSGVVDALGVGFTGGVPIAGAVGAALGAPGSAVAGAVLGVSAAGAWPGSSCERPPHAALPSSTQAAANHRQRG